MAQAAVYEGGAAHLVGPGLKFPGLNEAPEFSAGPITGKDRMSTWRLPAEIRVGQLVTCACGERHPVESFSEVGVPRIACYSSRSVPEPYDPIYDRRRFTALFPDSTFVEIERTW